MAKLVKKISEEERELKSSQNAGIFIILLVVAMLAFAVVYMGIFRDFDASGYVDAVLSQTFRGDVGKMTAIIEDAEEADLYTQYEDGISSFVENNITSGIEVDEETKAKFVQLCKEIFGSLKYNVNEAEKINRKEYHVPVEYQTVDIFQGYAEAVTAELNRLKEKMNKGEYTGTEEEIQAQMQAELLESAYTLLEKAYEEMQYAETETMIFTVKMTEDDAFAVKEGQIEEFITKIIGLDEIQD